jgi:hypothetical protein
LNAVAPHQQTRDLVVEQFIDGGLAVATVTISPPDGEELRDLVTQALHR